jgi:hypothetical protein
VTVISAPAGSGKTSLLRAWAGRPVQPRRLAVLQVQRDQQDAQQFWLALLDAVRRATGANSGAEPPAGTPDFNAPAMAGRLLSELADARGGVTLVIDDLHELTSPEALAQLDVCPAQACLQPGKRPSPDPGDSRGCVGVTLHGQVQASFAPVALAVCLCGQAGVGACGGLLEQCGELAALAGGEAGAEVPADRLPVDRPGAPQRVPAGRGEHGEAGPPVRLVRLALSQAGRGQLVDDAADPGPAEHRPLAQLAHPQPAAGRGVEL